MSEERIIKKYANRRLYDAQTRTHMTIDDVRKLLIAGETIKVIEGKSGDDITRQVLVQIIADQEQGGDPLFSNEMLHQLIRFYGGSMHEFMRAYLESSVQTFVEQQESLQTRLAGMMKATPVATMAEITRRNLEVWDSFQRQLLGGLTGRRGPGTEDDET